MRALAVTAREAAPAVVDLEAPEPGCYRRTHRTDRLQLLAGRCPGGSAFGHGKLGKTAVTAP